MLDRIVAKIFKVKESGPLEQPWHAVTVVGQSQASRRGGVAW
jgi:hypothetical protein